MTFGLGPGPLFKGKNEGPVPVPDVRIIPEGWEPVAGG